MRAVQLEFAKDSSRNRGRQGDHSSFPRRDRDQDARRVKTDWLCEVRMNHYSRIPVNIHHSLPRYCSAGAKILPEEWNVLNAIVLVMIRVSF
jgi:hypothetical protein